MSNQLERYLRDVAVQLHELPEAEREDQIQEIRAHLTAYATKQQAVGLGEEHAMQAAIAQFGKPDEVGRRIAHSVESPKLRILRVAAWGGLAAVIVGICAMFQVRLVGPHVILYAGLIALEGLMMGLCFAVAVGRVAVRWVGMLFGLYALVNSSIMVSQVWHTPHGISWHVTPIFFVQLILPDTFRLVTAVTGAWVGARLAERMAARKSPSAA